MRTTQLIEDFNDHYLDAFKRNITYKKGICLLRLVKDKQHNTYVMYTIMIFFSFPSRSYYALSSFR